MSVYVQCYDHGYPINPNFIVFLCDIISCRIPRIARPPSGDYPLEGLDSRVPNEQRTAPYTVPLGKSSPSPDVWVQGNEELPYAVGTGAVSRSRNYADYFYQRVRVAPYELPKYL